MIKENKNLALYGIGPLFAWPVIFVTIISAVVFGSKDFMFGKVNKYGILFVITGIILIALAVSLYVNAVFISKLKEHIEKEQLLTTGVYAYVRNPIYSAVLFACTGILLIVRNYCLLFLPIIYWMYVTYLLKKTEEIWMADFFGQQYLDYCKKTNRCIPWIHSKK